MSFIDKILGTDDAADASREAGRIQAEATEKAIKEQRRQFETVRGDLAPFRDVGAQVLTGIKGPRTDPRLEELESLKKQLAEVPETITDQKSIPRGNMPHPAQGGLPFDQRPTTSTTRANPEFNKLQKRINELQSDIESKPFEVERTGPGLVGLVTDPEAQRDFITENPFFDALAQDAQDRIFSNQAARGKLGSGETAEALQNSLVLLGSDLLNQNISQRQSLVTGGQNAAAQTGSFGQQATANITDLITSGAASRAAGTVGAANAITQGRQGLLNAGATAAGLILSDRKTKKNVKKVGTDEKGLNVYTYKYKGDDETRIGHMAQDVKKKFPQAVKTIADLNMIDYSRLETA